MKSDQNLHQVAADKTRSKIINAAEKLFLEKGFRGTSFASIARAADIPQPLLYHYFQNKEDCWKAVRESIVQSVHDEAQSEIPPLPQILSGLETVDSLEDLVLYLVRYRASLYASHPGFRRMMMWQLLEGVDDDRKAFTPQMLAHWRHVITREQACEHIRDDINVDEVLALLIGSVWTPFMSALDLSGGDARQHIEALVQVILRGLSQGSTVHNQSV